MTAREPKIRVPKVIIHLVPKEIEKDDIIKYVYQQNEILQGNNTGFEEFERGFMVRFPLGNRNKSTSSWVVDVSPQNRIQLLKLGKLNLQWVRCPVEDFVPIVQCFNCCRMGHFARDCKQETPTCSQCGEGHRYRDCPNKNTVRMCCNCKRDKLADTRHNALDRKCPLVLRAKATIISRTDYGGGIN
ncbi:uncharacterized protein LOC111639857 [Centruroides sculpturatus]|uniref:uncharacterized protein LOC111639857 n=1 Tax=Centruroides sculpturatus TaxID=218467 RepID=UPI000C6CC0F7|nr:uncharacterized protein LOC111639857 [Centruroides sculpturatus]